MCISRKIAKAERKRKSIQGWKLLQVWRSRCLSDSPLVSSFLEYVNRRLWIEMSLLYIDNFKHLYQSIVTKKKPVLTNKRQINLNVCDQNWRLDRLSREDRAKRNLIHLYFCSLDFKTHHTPSYKMVDCKMRHAIRFDSAMMTTK